MGRLGPAPGRAHQAFISSRERVSMSPSPPHHMLPAASSDARRNLAPTYDLSYRDVFWRDRAYEDRCDRLALRRMLPGSGRHLLDLGAGFGRLIDEYGSFDMVTLVDASPVMLDAARHRAGEDRRFAFVLAPADRLPIPDDSVDVVVAIRLLVHLEDPGPVFREIARVLRPGGRCIIEFANRRHILALLRRAAGRQSWSPRGAGAQQYLPGHFAHQPVTVRRQLHDAGLQPVAIRAVSMFRSAWLKKLFGPLRLAALDGWLQDPLGRFVLSPSVFVASVRSEPTQVRETLRAVDPEALPAVAVRALGRGEE